MQKSDLERWNRSQRHFLPRGAGCRSARGLRFGALVGDGDREPSSLRTRRDKQRCRGRDLAAGFPGSALRAAARRLRMRAGSSGSIDLPTPRRRRLQSPPQLPRWKAPYTSMETPGAPGSSGNRREWPRPHHQHAPPDTGAAPIAPLMEDERRDDLRSIISGPCGIPEVVIQTNSHSTDVRAVGTARTGRRRRSRG